MKKMKNRPPAPPIPPRASATAMTAVSPREPRPASDVPEVDRIYGLHPAEEALRNPRRRIRRVLATRNAANRLAGLLASRGLVPEIVTPKDIARRLSPDAVHQGILLLADPLPSPGLEDIAVGNDTLLVLLDQVTDPHNVGAILRSACAFGVAAVITTTRHAPRASPVMLKAASGAMEHVPLVAVTNLARAIMSLKEKGCTVLGLDSQAPGRLGCGMALAGPVALVLGAEGKGLRQKTRTLCDALVRLDMPGAIRSLNVSNAAAVALFAIVESRRMMAGQAHKPVDDVLTPGNDSEEHRP